MQIFGACIWKKVIILLDEYDTPMQEANVYGYWEEMTSFLRNLFHATFKTNACMERAVMTGITRWFTKSEFGEVNHHVFREKEEERFS